MPTYRIDNFAGGRDKRPRQFYGKEKDRFRNLDDAYIGKDKKVHRRFPLRFIAGTVTTGGTSGFGAISIDGVVTYFAPSTATPVVSLPGVVTAILVFDELPAHVAVAIVDAKMFNGSVVALIKHEFYINAGTASGKYTYKLHVFDGLAGKPTYVEDPYFPTCWSLTRPLHLYRTGTLGAFLNYVPRMGIAAGKVYVSGPDNNLYFSAPSNARVWNTRTPTQLRDEGEWFYWDNYETIAASTLVDTTVGPRWIVYERQDRLTGGNPFGVWTCYVLEYCATDGTWVQMIEDAATGAAPTVDGHYQLKAIGGAGSGKLGFKIKVPAGASAIWRFRIILGPPPIVVTSGGVWSTISDRSAVTFTFEGLAQVAPAVAGLPGLGSDNCRFLLVAPSTDPQYVDTVLGGTVIYPFGAYGHMTGYQRYRSLVIGWAYDITTGVPVSSHTELATFLLYMSGVYTINLGYGFTSGNAWTWYSNRIAYQLGAAGNGLAGFLPTSTRAKADGGPITAISTIKDYIGVHYRSLTLLYAVNPNQLLDAVRDAVAFGTGAYTDGVVVQFHNQTILFSERGFRAFSVGGYLSDRADDTNIGEAVETFDPANTSLLTAAYWPYTGQYVAMLSVGGIVYLYVFDYSKDSKIAAWSRWRIGATPTIRGACALVVVGTRLYVILSSGGIAYLDAAAADGQWTDDLDLTGASNVYEYESVAETYLNDFGQAAVDKKITRLDLVSRGTTDVSFNLLSNNVERNIPGTVVANATYGGNRVRLAMRAYAVGVRFASTDHNEWILDAYALDFTAIQR